MRAALPHCLLTLAALAALGTGSPPAAAQEEGPAAACAKGTSEANTALATAYMNAFATADDKVFDEILSTDYRHHFGIGEDVQTPAGLKQRVAEWHRAFKGGAFDIEQVIAGDDMVVVRWKRTGTQVGAFGGLPPSQAETTYTGINIFRIKCNKVAESWNESDHLGRLIAAGVLTPEKLSAPGKP